MRNSSEVYIRLVENEPAFICTILGMSVRFAIAVEPEIPLDTEEEGATAVRIRRSPSAGLRDAGSQA
jgi:hypothetical protein